jgi:starch phosphorylase
MTPIEIAARGEAEMEIPEAFSGLRELAYNLWWTWSAAAHRLFHSIDSRHWLQYRNPIQLLINVTPRRWTLLLGDPGFWTMYRQVLDEYRTYMAGADHGWFRHERPDYPGGPIAYFSTEFGWHECLASYSGGLGVLAGDHSKAASDLGLPFVGVGLMCRRGYFRQTVGFDGEQQHTYPDLDPNRLPLRMVVRNEGEELRVPVEFPGRLVHLGVWKADVGRIPVLLLDSDVEENDEADRKITAVLYVRGREMRLCQELLLGIGGVRALAALGLAPAVWHINEGHSAMLSVERMLRLVEREGLSLAQAPGRVAEHALFTTHTPVPAGNESFDVGLVHRYLEPHADRAGVDLEELLALGRAHPDDAGQFNMTALAIRTSRTTNGVSELHGRVAGQMWRHLREPAEVPTPGTPVEHVTNGVHIATWLGPEMAELLARHLGRDFLLHLLDPWFAAAVDAIPDQEVWDSHLAQKRRLVSLARESMLDQFARHGRSPDELREVESVFDPDALTVGFARRFATYKRADLLFRDPPRLQAIASRDGRPVQFIFAGKAHPADRPGQELIRRIWQISRSPEFLGRVVFLENYGMRIARFLVQGVDLWLNTPRRPLEASGTSGMKAAVNGGLNLSVLDGWWREGYDPRHGWAIGNGEDHEDEARRDAEDAESLYRLLDEEVAPCYYRRDASGLPREWIARMRVAMGSLIPRFSASRMVEEYARKYYLPAMDAGR